MAIFYFARRAPKLRYYGDVMHSFYWKSAVEHDVVFKMRDSVPIPRYSPVCNVLRQWKTSLIPTYTVYRLYDNNNYRKGMKENNEKIERDHAEEREEIYALEIIDYLTFLCTPPLSEVGMQVPRSILSSWYAFPGNISSAKILIGLCISNYECIYSYGRIERLDYLKIE